MKKKILLISAAVIVLAAVCVIGYTLAYFTAETDVKTNVFTIGNVDGEVFEDLWDEENTHEFTPGEELTKDPAVRNTGKNDAYVKLDVTISNDFYNALTAKDSSYNLFTLIGDVLGANWIYAGVSTDGKVYSFYYTEILPAGSTNNETSTLFDTITLPIDFNSDDFGETDVISIDIIAYLIQSAGFDRTEVDWTDDVEILNFFDDIFSNF